MRLAKPLLAESLGTLALVLIGAGAATVLAQDGTVATTLAQGSVIAALACAFGDDGGSCIEPALAVALVSSRRTPVPRRRHGDTRAVARRPPVMFVDTSLPTDPMLDTGVRGTAGRFAPIEIGMGSRPASRASAR